MKIYIKTFGCSMNVSDSERIAGRLMADGFEITDDESKAGLIIINSCTVKSPTANKIRRYLLEMQQKGKRIVLAGCIPQAEPDFMEVSMIGPSQIDNIVLIVEETLNGNTVKLLVDEKKDKLSMPIIRKNKVVEILPICEGCLGDPCAYCIVKRARGELRSYPKKQIINKILLALDDGIKEIWLSAQDTGCYGYDIGTNIVELLEEVVTVKGDFRIRLGMANPNHIIHHIDGLKRVMKSEKIFRFLHVPIQSGNDIILKKMRRKYTVYEFRHIVKEMRAFDPFITIATDVICGFPEETDEQFKDSVEMIREIKPDVVNISKFWLRPGTEAEKLIQVPGEEIKDRSKLLTEVFEWVTYENNRRWVGKRCRVLVDEIGKEGAFVARNESYKPVVLNGKHAMGSFRDVDIIGYHTYDIVGNVVGNNNVVVNNSLNKH